MSESYEAYLAKLRAQPCQCIRCTDCDGFGSIDDPFDYSGQHAEPCMHCDSSGIVEECERCMELADAEANQ